MTESEWLTCTNPMLLFQATEAPRVEKFFCSWVPGFGAKELQRRLRLLICACMRAGWHKIGEYPRKGIEIAEQFADGNISRWQLGSTQRKIGANWIQKLQDMNNCMTDFLGGEILEQHLNQLSYSYRRLWSVRGAANPDALVCNLTRDVFRGPFQPNPPAKATSFDGSVKQLAEAAYEHRLLPSGHLDVVRLSVLADALEEAGGDASLLEHLRQPGAVHVRGCWVVDLLTGRE